MAGNGADFRFVRRERATEKKEGKKGRAKLEKSVTGQHSCMTIGHFANRNR